VFASRDEVGSAIGDPDRLILDVRSREEFDGECFWPSGATENAGRAGRIPSAVHLPFDLLLDENRRLKRPSEIRALCAARGVEADRGVVTYCTIGNRASLVWFALRYVVGVPDARVYYGSWVEWGKLAGTPVERS
jgi:thiosulfate/3-mercaptopyruvate sulfurtransferase